MPRLDSAARRFTFSPLTRAMFHAADRIGRLHRMQQQRQRGRPSVTMPSRPLRQRFDITFYRYRMFWRHVAAAQAPAGRRSRRRGFISKI